MLSGSVRLNYSNWLIVPCYLIEFNSPIEVRIALVRYQILSTATPVSPKIDITVKTASRPGAIR